MPPTPDSNTLLKNALLELRRMRTELSAIDQAKTEPIAIIGMGCRFPGGATDPQAYWELLKNGIDAVSEVPADRWDIDALYDPDPEAPGKMYTRYASFLPQVDQFDPQFFGISPREAAGMDPQQRLLLEVSWEALEHAGQAPDRLAGSATGAFIGIFRDDYAQLSINSGDFNRIDAYTSLGVGRSIAVGRLSYVLGLQGPTMQLDTACSSSLLAVHLACQSLRAQECHLALAGGVNLMLTPEAAISNCKLKAVSVDGRCKTFDASADGYGRGEGCGIVVLKRLSTAIADGDTILALIRGSAVNHDGHSNGLTAPNGAAQEALLRQALANARVKPEQIQYVEVHGTGTSLGDPIEVLALGAVLGQGRSESERLTIGSVKTNFGHLEGAAGVAALMKVVLALQHQQIPPHLHFNTPNPYIPWARLPVVVPTTLTPWPVTAGQPQLAGVSAFAMSGTNVHLIVEAAGAASPLPAAPSSQPERPLHLLTLSAKSAAALQQLATAYVNELTDPAVNLANICFTANGGRSQFEYRLAVWAESPEQMRDRLQTLAVGPTAGGIMGQVDRHQSTKVAFLFTGQGSQHLNMGRELYETQPIFRKTLDRCAELLSPHLEHSLLDILYSATTAAQLDQTAYTQPALFALEVALAQLWQSWGIAPSVVMGHSVGEYAAACIAGVFSLEDGIALIAARSRLMQALPAGGTMVAVMASEAVVRQAIQPYGDRVAIAAINGAEQVVISGDETTIAILLKEWETGTLIDGDSNIGNSNINESGNGNHAGTMNAMLRTQPLTVSHAFHSPLMQPMMAAFEQVARRITYHPPRLAVISNLTGTGAGAEITTPDYWCRHVLEPVRFADGMATLQQQGYEIFVEIGPKPLLIGLGQRCGPVGTGTWLPSLRPGQSDWQVMLAGLAQLYVQGVAVDWRGFDRDYSRRRVVLPTYPFQRQRYWVEVPASRSPLPLPSEQLHPLVHQPLHLAGALEHRFESQISQKNPAFLTDHRVFDTPILPAAAYLEMVLAAGRTVCQSAHLTLEQVLIQQALVLRPEPTSVQLVLTPSAASQFNFQIFSRATGTAGDWTLHASGSLRASDQPAPDQIDLAALQTRCDRPLPIAPFYSQFQQRGLEYGPNFQAVTQLWAQAGEVLTQIQLPESLLATADRYELHPVLLDACFQSLAAAFPEVADGDTFLPVSIEQVQVYHRPASRLWSHTQKREANGASDAQRQVDQRLLNDTGAVVAEITGLTIQRASQAAVQRELQQDLSNDLYEVVWQRSDRPAQPSPLPQRWLIFGDETGVGLTIAEQLQQRGDDCVLVAVNSVYERRSAHYYGLNPADPQQFQQLLQDSGTDAAPYTGIVHLWGLSPAATPELALADLQAAQLLGCGTALHLVQALAALAGPVMPRLWLVTQGAQAVGTPASVQVQQSALWGLGKVIGLEQPDIRCTCIDLDPALQALQPLSADLLAELRQPDREDQIALRQGDRYVARLTRRSQSATSTPTPQLINGQSSYLITGGLGALGLQVAHWLVQQGARSLVLVGRRGAEAGAAAIAPLEQSGAQVRVVKADITQPVEVAKLLETLQLDLPPLRGIIQAAGVLADGTLLQQTWPQFTQVMAPKLAGAWNLHTQTQHLPLDFFVCFSSIASLLGSPGQSNYAAANAFLDGLAHYRQALGLPGLSLNWGAWAEGGMAQALSSRERSRLAQRGVGTIAPRQGLSALAALLPQPAAQVGVMPMDWAKFLAPFAGDLPPLFEVVAPSQGRSPQQPAWLQHLAATPVLERRGLLLNHIRTLLAEVLGIAPAESVDVNRGFFELGMDSLMSIEIRNRLHTSLGCALSATLVFKYPTVTALVDYLIEDVLSLDFTLPSDSLAAPANSPPKDIAPDLEEFSQAEIAALLMQELATTNG